MANNEMTLVGVTRDTDPRTKGYDPRPYIAVATASGTVRRVPLDERGLVKLIREAATELERLVDNPTS